ncbi:hypothetical protein ABEB36_007228 [Hypothenemus hampei]|uniref:C-type lectin domain-containing protein n=1 Tax=Hypothenemus hampei TaxID=57062 RepID=A0ABD1ETG0_HYPHA
MRLAFFLTLTLTATLAAPNTNLFLEDTTQDDYIISGVTANYIQAYLICKKNGFIMAMERTEEETEIIKEKITELQVEDYDHYLGGFNEVTDSVKQWFWIDSNQSITYDHWSDTGEKKLDCLLKTSLNSDDAGKWTSNNCAEEKYFICQKPPLAQTYYNKT